MDLYLPDFCRNALPVGMKGSGGQAAALHTRDRLSAVDVAALLARAGAGQHLSLVD